MAKWNLIQRSLVLSSFGRLDAEYYHPTNLQAYTKVVNHNHTFVRDIAKEGYRVVYENTKLIPQAVATLDMPLFVQATNINAADGEIEFASCGCTVASDWDNYPKGRIKRGELLIEVKGQAEKVTIVPDYAPENALISGSLFKLEVDEKKISPSFVYVYFCTKYGRTLRDRVKTNTLIGFVSKPQLYAIPIVVPNADFQAEIEKMVKDSFLQRRKSRELYSFACSLLASALKINELKFNRPLSYTTKFSDVLHARRADAEYYQPKYQAIAEKLAQYNNGTVSCKNVLTNAMTKLTSGTEYCYLELADIGKSGEINSCMHDIAENLPSRARQKVKTNDVIVSSVEGSLASCALITEEFNNAICSTGFHVLRSAEINPETLLLLMKSTPIQALLKQGCSGTILTAILPDALKAIKLPLIRKEVQNELAAKVQESFALRKESKRLLNLAKHAVEVAIEQGEDAAMKLLGENV